MKCFDVRTFYSFNLLFLHNDHNRSNLNFSSSRTDKGAEEGSLVKSPLFARMSWNGTKILHLWQEPHRAWYFKHCSLFVPVLNSIRRNDGGGNKQLPPVSGELEKRPLCPKIVFGQA
jgi:hypothetical protein